MALPNEGSASSNASLDAGIVSTASRNWIGVGGTPTQPPPREELINSGMTSQQVDQIEVRRHQQEVMQQHFMRWMCAFMCVLVILLPVLLGLLIWVIICWNYARKEEVRCDTDLIEWVTVIFVLRVYQTFVHRWVIRCVCKYNDQDQPPTPAPLHVKLFNVLIPLFNFSWMCIGLYMVNNSEDCHEKMPSLFDSISSYASVSIVFDTLVIVNAVGVYTIFAFMLRNGMLRSSSAAPSGTLEAQKVVQYNAEDFIDNPSCSICMDDFDSGKQIKLTHCGHHFHTKCLKGWLQVNHTCPLCRANLGGHTATPESVGQTIADEHAEPDSTDQV